MHISDAVELGALTGFAGKGMMAAGSATLMMLSAVSRMPAEAVAC